MKTRPGNRLPAPAAFSESQRERVLRLLQAAGGSGLTRNEIATYGHMRIQSVCLRVSELLQRGVIARSGQTRRSEGLADTGEENEVLILAGLNPNQSSLEAWMQ